MIITILGAPGSGKGTQAKLIASSLGVSSISVGELLRNEVKKGTDEGLKASGYMERGEWVPANITIKVLTNALEQIDLNKGVVIDAFPRLLEEKALLDHYLSSRGYKLNLVINLKVDDKFCLDRIRYRRSLKDNKQTIRKDESDEVTLKRIALHHKTVSPILEEFRKEDKLIEVDGNRDIEPIQEDIKRVIDSYK